MMAQRGSTVDAEYSKDPKKGTGEINPDSRRVTQENIDEIFTDKIKKELQTTGIATIGTVTNDLYTNERKKLK